MFHAEANQFLLEVVVVDALKLKVLRYDVVLLVQDGQHEMFGAHNLRMELLGNDVSELQHTLGLLGEGQGQNGAFVDICGPHRGFQFF